MTVVAVLVALERGVRRSERAGREELRVNEARLRRHEEADDDGHQHAQERRPHEKIHLNP